MMIAKLVLPLTESVIKLPNNTGLLCRRYIALHREPSVPQEERLFSMLSIFPFCSVVKNCGEKSKRFPFFLIFTINELLEELISL